MPAIVTPSSGTDDIAARLQAAVGDGYVITRELPPGGLSRLFLATDHTLAREVFIKVISLDAADGVTGERFRREMATSARLQHPHIMPILAAGTGEGLLYYIMPRANGESLRARLGREFRLSVVDAARVVAELCSAVHYAHRQGILHRDIKPENVLLQADGERALLSEFGIARALAADKDARLTGTGMSIGTSGYMAPEQLLAPEQVDERSDIYALGIVAYELLAGERPFKSDAHALSSGPLVAEPPKLAAVRRDIPHNVSEVVARAMARDPARRYRTANDFGAAMLRAAAPAAVRRRNRMLVGGLALAVLAVVVLALRTSRRHGIEDGLVAVVPFDVLDQRYALWREGIVDIVSANLEGAGSLHAVPASVSIRQWRGRGDHASASEFGRRLGARLALYGRLVPAGRDSVRLTASLVDVLSGQSIANIEFTEYGERMDRLTDSLTVHVLRELNGGRGDSPALSRPVGFAARSLPALKAFLKGEQFYRGAHWDSATAQYEDAVRLDPTMAVAWSRLNRVTLLSGIAAPRDSFVRMAVQYSAGLNARERLLIFRDSLVQDVSAPPRGEPHRVALARLRGLVDSIAASSPRDPEMWLLVAEDRAGFLRSVGTTSVEALDAAERAIALDSMFALPHNWAFILSLDEQGWPGALPRIPGIMRSQISGDLRAAYSLVAALAQRQRGADAELERASPTVLIEGAIMSATMGDDRRIGLRLARARVKVGGLSAREAILLLNVFRLYGRPGESAGLATGNPAMQARVPITTGDTAAMRSMLREWIGDTSHVEIPVMLDPLLAAHAQMRDVAMLTEAAGVIHAIAASTSDAGAAAHWQYLASGADGYLALARGDTAAAIASLGADNPGCMNACSARMLTLVRVLNQSGRTADASTVFARGDGFYGVAGTWGWQWLRAPWLFERARNAEARGDLEAAARDYRRVAEVWAEAEPQFQPTVAEARERLRKLGK